MKEWIDDVWFRIKWEYNELRYKVISFFQWCKRGFSDDVVWNFDYSIAKWILPRLKRFREIDLSLPTNITDDEWKVILDKIIEAFELIKFEWEDEYNSIIDEYKEREEKIKEGLRLFVEHYGDLWV